VAEVRQRRPIVKRRRRQTRSDQAAEREAQEYFKREVLRLDFGKCVGIDRLGFEHECTGPIQAHHAVPQKVLRAHISTLELDAAQIRRWLWSPDNGVTVCEGLHGAHSARVLHAEPFWIPLEWLPARCLDFAEAAHIRHLLERQHPPLFERGVC
jgi:hypothetical protein